MTDPRSILILEDEPLIAFMIKEELERHGWHIVGPFSTVDAARAALQPDLHARLFDINLGEETSFDLAIETIAIGMNVIFLTGANCDRLPDALSHLPVQAKPIDFAALNTLLDQLRR